MGKIAMMCPDCGGYRHEGPCVKSHWPEPTELDMLQAHKEATNQHHLDLIRILPAMNVRNAEQQALIDAARELALAARDAYLDAGGTP